ncbi:MAG: oligoendopeptidase F, partial [Fusobacteriaceae bacterium]
KTWGDWEKDVAEVKKLADKIPSYQGKIEKDCQKFIELTELEEKIGRLLDRVYLYPYLMKDLNAKDLFASEKVQEIEFLWSKIGVDSAWISPEILKIPKETMISWINENKILEQRRFNIMELYRLQSHVLDEKSEKLLSYFSQFNGVVNDIYQELTTSDIKWNKINLIDDKGEIKEEVEVSYGLYGQLLATNRIQENRKNAFEALYNSFKMSEHTLATIYRGIVQKSVASVKARNYKSTLDRALEGKNIDPEVYMSLLKAAKENSAPLRRYSQIRKKFLKLKEYHIYDETIDLVGYEKEYDYEEAKKIVLESVTPLGKHYKENLSHAISDGWLDVYETENKRSGAYSINIFDVHPYMLLNYNKTMDAVFTLAHELGHTLHSMYSAKNQPYATSQYTIFVAEVASTFNERLLLDDMLKISKDPKEKISLLEQSLGNVVGTFYRQTLFADYEYQVHKLAEDGQPITADTLSGIMKTLWEEYYGETITKDELQKIVWSRIPHFYNSPFYVFQYATSFSASANLYDKVTNPKYSEQEREASKEKYLELLKSGGNDHPIEQLKKAGVDLTRPESFKAVTTEFDRLLDIFEKELSLIFD